MFERLFPRRAPESPKLPEPDAQLALGALLVRVALADREYNAEEVAQIDRILTAMFDMKPLDAAKLRATCEALERDAPGTPEFADILRVELDYQHRHDLAEAMWKVVLADGKRRDIEESMLHQIEGALGITPEDSAEMQADATGV
ncbi:MAG: putative tellurite resistance protein B-like protein [Ascidiaceihabitans sp.]|jgi:uncharacterized tellurite resistance protein B-like protein